MSGANFNILHFYLTRAWQDHFRLYVIICERILADYDQAADGIPGWLYDVLNSYAPGYYMAGGAISLSGLILFLIPMLERRRDRAQWDREMPLEHM